MDKAISELRKKYSIPETYIPYIHNGSYLYDVVLKSQENPSMEYAHFNYSEEKITSIENYGMLKGDFFFIVRMYDMDTDRDWVYLFTEDLQRFHKEFLYLKPKPNQKCYYSAGLYEPVHTMLGWTLSPLPLGETIKPILNDNLFDTLNNEINMFIKRKEIYDEMKLSYKRGILLFGSCGNGKTSFIKHLLKDQKDAISIICDKNDSGQISFLMDFLADDYYKNILKIIVIEDIDGMQSSIRSVLLNFLDGLTPTHKTIFIATTNFPERLDIAIRNRPSRFDSVHHIGLPNKDARSQLLKYYFPQIGNGQLVECANSSEGFSGAYFKEIYILSRLNGVSPLTAIEEIKRRFKTFEKCGDE